MNQNMPVEPETEQNNMRLERSISVKKPGEWQSDIILDSRHRIKSQIYRDSKSFLIYIYILPIYTHVYIQ